MSSLKEPYWNPTWWPLALRTKGFTRGGAEYTESLTQDHPCCCFCSFLFLVDRVRRPHTTSMPSNKLKGKNPWTLPFSVGSTLQSSTLKAWLGKEENILKARLLSLPDAKRIERLPLELTKVMLFWVRSWGCLWEPPCQGLQVMRRMKFCSFICLFLFWRVGFLILFGLRFGLFCFCLFCCYYYLYYLLEWW